MSEAALQRRIAQALRDRGAYVVKVHGNEYTAAGTPDLLVCYRGAFVGLEVKQPGRERTLTKIQRHTLGLIADAGGHASLVTSPEQALLVLDEIDAEESPS